MNNPNPSATIKLFRSFFVQNYGFESRYNFFEADSESRPHKVDRTPRFPTTSEVRSAFTNEQLSMLIQTNAAFTIWLRRNALVIIDECIFASREDQKETREVEIGKVVIALFVGFIDYLSVENLSLLIAFRAALRHEQFSALITFFSNLRNVVNDEEFVDSDQLSFTRCFKLKLRDGEIGMGESRCPFRSASMELLNYIVRVIKNNPDKIFFLQSWDKPSCEYIFNYADSKIPISLES